MRGVTSQTDSLDGLVFNLRGADPTSQRRPPVTKYWIPILLFQGSAV